MAYRTHQSFKLTPLWVIVIANILLFVITTVDITLTSLFGLQPASLLARPWTIVTNLFIHVGLWHITANMLALYFFGTYLSRLLGDSRFLIVYFLGGILGNIFFILLAPAYAIAVGASGAIFALGGALAVMRPRLRVIVIPIPTPLPLWAAVIGGFVIISLFPFVAWQAHLGGLALGLMAGYIFRKRERHFLW